MALKNNVQVVIDGKVYTLSGYEDPEYLNKVAAYINAKLSEMRMAEGYKRQNREVQNILMYLNVADDYYKAKRNADTASLELEERVKEISNLKHELVGLKIRMEEEEKELETLRKTISEQEKTIIRLEAEAEAAHIKTIQKTDGSIESVQKKEKRKDEDRNGQEKNENQNK